MRCARRQFERFHRSPEAVRGSSGPPSGDAGEGAAGLELARRLWRPAHPPDFIPLVDVAHEAGWTVEMAAFKSAFSPMGATAMKVDRIRPLDDALERIGDTTSGIWIRAGED